MIATRSAGADPSASAVVVAAMFDADLLRQISANAQTAATDPADQWVSAAQNLQRTPLEKTQLPEAPSLIIVALKVPHAGAAAPWKFGQCTGQSRALDSNTK